MAELQITRIDSSSDDLVLGDVIFVHGLGGSCPGTWQHKGDRDSFWPLWLHQDLPDLAIWCLQYPADATKWGSKGGDMTLTARAKSILDYLLSHGIGLRPLIFVAHSLGGLLVKEALRQGFTLNKEDWLTLCDNTRGVCFLGTPHAGSLVASIVGILPFLNLTHLTEQLSQASEEVLEVTLWYQQNATGRGLATACYYEKKPTHGAIVVDQASSSPNVAGCIPIPVDADHFELSRPKTRQAPVYVGVKAFVSQRLSSNHVVAHRIGGYLPTRSEAPGLESDFEFFTSVVGPKRLDLVSKLQLGNRSYELARATRLKERFSKELERNKLQPSALRPFIHVLSSIETRFHSEVTPAIAAGMNKAKVDHIIKKKVFEPVLELVKQNGYPISETMIDGAKYYLGGNCHLRWDVDDNA